MQRCSLFAVASGVALLTAGALAQPTQSQELALKGPHHRWVETKVVESDELGNRVERSGRYCELATGLHRWDEDRKDWVEAKPEFEVTPKGYIIARQTAHQVILSPDLLSEGAVDFLTPQGQRLRSTPLGIAVVDTRSGESKLIAELKSVVPELVSSTEVIARDAFDGISADIRFRIALDRFEADVILREKPVLPEGFDPKTTKLEVLTEFFDNPTIQSVKRAAVSSADAQALTDAKVEAALPDPDPDLDVGGMVFGRGRAFVEKHEADLDRHARVKKSYESLEGRQFLVEMTDWGDVEELAGGLPEVQEAMNRPQWRSAQGKHVVPRTVPGVVRYANAPRYEGRRLVAEPSVKRVAAIAPTKQTRPGVVLDYTLLSSTNNVTLLSSETYLVSGSVNVNTALVIEGSSVCKFEVGSGIYVWGTVTCLTGPYRPAIFCSKDDNSVGEILPGSTGTPTGYYASSALAISSGNVTLSDLRVCHATRGIHNLYSDVSGTRLTLRNVQLINCKAGLLGVGGITYPGYIYAGNLLAVNCEHLYRGQNTVVTLEHATADKMGYVASTVTSTNLLKATNCVFTSITNLNDVTSPLQGAYNGFYASSTFGSSTFSASSTPFVIRGQGSHYVDPAAGFQNCGTSAIEAATAALLKERTSYAPVSLSGTISQNTVLSPQAQRDTDTPDLGYHYAPIDYWVSGLTVAGSTLVLTNGVALATDNTPVVKMQAGGQLVSEGTPLRLNRLVRYHSVQEQGNNSWPVSSSWTLIKDDGALGSASAVKLRFSELTVPASSGGLTSLGVTAQTLALTDCQLAGGTLSVIGSGATVALTNNLLERVGLVLGSTVSNTMAYARNNDFVNCSVSLQPAVANTWEWRDNLFDTNTLTQSGFAILNSHNAYRGTTRITPNAASDVLLTALVYGQSTLGRYYVSSSAPTLVNVGSRIAGASGLYHYTTAVGQGIEGASQVDIGFHYVACTSGVPTDTDGDGMPNYMEDRNGNGNVDSGETNWNNPTDPGVHVWITRPSKYGPLP